MSHPITSASTAPPVRPAVTGSSSVEAFSPPPAFRPPATAEVTQHDLEVPVIISKFVSLCCRCSHSFVASFVPYDPEWRGNCEDCEQLLWSTQEPLAAIPGCPCAVSAGAVACICGRRASEHCPEKENHAVQSAVRKHRQSDKIKVQALRAGYRNLKKTVYFHKRYLQAMGIYAPPTHL